MHGRGARRRAQERDGDRHRDRGRPRARLERPRRPPDPGSRRDHPPRRRARRAPAHVRRAGGARRPDPDLHRRALAEPPARARARAGSVAGGVAGRNPLGGGRRAHRPGRPSASPAAPASTRRSSQRSRRCSSSGRRRARRCSRSSRGPPGPRRSPTTSSGAAMPELRKDPVVERWVIIATERARRPMDFAPEAVTPRGPNGCPFCPGHEERTPPELYPLGRIGGRPVGGAGRPEQVPGPPDGRRGPRGRRGDLRSDRRGGRARGRHREPRPLRRARDAPRVARGRDPGRVPRAAPRPPEGPAARVRPDLQEPRRRGRRLARAPALPAHRDPDPAGAGGRGARGRRALLPDEGALRVVRRRAPGATRRKPARPGGGRLRRGRAVRPALPLRDVDPSHDPPAELREPARRTRWTRWRGSSET